jgi:hypothetical protein
MTEVVYPEELTDRAIQLWLADFPILHAQADCFEYENVA